MSKKHHKITFHTILYGFFGVSLLLLSYSLVASGHEGRSAFKSRLNEPLIRGGLSAQTAASFIYLQRNHDIGDPRLSATSSLVWDSASSTPLWSHNHNERRPIASITKLITAATVVDMSRLDEPVVISDTAVATQGTAGNLQPGEALTVESLLQALLIESSNDAAVALAEHVEEYTGTPFVTLMNKKAAELGMANTYVNDPAGLVDEGSYSTAQDLALLLDQLRTNPSYAPVWEILSHPTLTTFSADGGFVHTFENTNPFLKELGGVIGGKTGFTSGAGQSMVLVVQSPDNSRELYYIILGSEDRFKDMRTLISWVGSAYIWEQRPQK